MSRTLLMVGTRKGMWLGTSDEARTSWDWTGPHFPMEEVYSVMIDQRGPTPRLLAGASSSWLTRDEENPVQSVLWPIERPPSNAIRLTAPMRSASGLRSSTRGMTSCL